MSTYRNDYHLTLQDVKNLRKADEVSFYTGKTRENGKIVWGSWIHLQFKVRGHDGSTTCLIKADAILRDYSCPYTLNPKSNIRTVHAEVKLDDTAKKQALLALIRPNDTLQLIWTIGSYHKDFTDMLVDTLTVGIQRESRPENRKNYEVLIDYSLKKPGWHGMIGVNRYPE